MEKAQDAIVVGGGPAGSFCAFELAKRDIVVTVLEEHKEIGEPSHCAGHISIRSLRRLGLYPLPDGIVENTFSAANFYSPYGSKFSVHLSQPVTCALNRAKFDKHLGEKAEAAGAKFHLNARAQSLLKGDKFVSGVNVIQNEGTEQQFQAKLVVDAEGISSRLMRQSGLKTLRSDALVYAVEAELENVKDVEEHAVEVYLGKDYAPGFYGWLIPRSDGSAKVGLATRSGNPKNFFERLMQKHPVASKQLRNAHVKKLSFHAITLGGLVPQACTDGFMAVGDCASQVKPTTGGGVVFGITCAKIAAEVAAQTLKEKDVTAKSLMPYQQRLQETLGFDVAVMLKGRKAIDTFSDNKIDQAIRFAQKVGLGESLRNVDEIDFQGQMLIKTLAKPTAYATLAYLLKLYLLQ